ncbi:MAG: hypothetical protein B6I22_10720 [Desulfobacteraceae bacterium 4572_123]|nr:MAG: hypothetical protein B6I22_10720 [Desulfobacteraceae bacterium 4572_123]
MNEPEIQLKKQHKFHDYLYWNLVASVPIITACITMFKVSIALFGSYIALLVFMIIIIYRFFCSHCPHYINSEKVVKCMFIWGIPKYFKARPGPLNLFEKGISLIAPIVLIFFPIYWIRLYPDLLVIYLLSLAVFGMTIRRNECVRCIYFDCPANRVNIDIKNQSQ